MRQEKKALKDTKRSGSLFLYNPNPLIMVTDSSNCHLADNSVNIQRYSEKKQYLRNEDNFELDLFFHTLELDI